MLLVAGLLFAGWASRIPAIKTDLALTEGQLAIGFMGLNAGAVLGLQLGGIIVPHIGSRLALVLSLPTFSVALLAPGVAPNFTVLVAALFFSPPSTALSMLP